MEVLISVTAIIFSNLTFMALIFFWWRAKQRKIELQADVQSKLIEKFASNRELVEFLQSPAGRDFVTGVQMGAVSESRERILAGIRRAIVLLFLGLAFAGLWIGFNRVGLGFAVPALIFLALGAGNLVAAIVSLVVGRRLGLSMGQTNAVQIDG